MNDLLEKKVSMTIVPIRVVLALVIGLLCYYYFEVEETFPTTPVKISGSIKEIKKPADIDIYNVEEIGEFVTDYRTTSTDLEELYNRIKIDCDMEEILCRKIQGALLKAYFKLWAQAPPFAQEYVVFFCGHDIEVIPGSPVNEMDAIYPDCDTWVHIIDYEVVGHSSGLTRTRATYKVNHMWDKYDVF